MTDNKKCGLCGEPMPEGETMFKYHGYSGPCPKPPLKKMELDPAGVPKVDLTELERFAVQIINNMKALSDDGSVVLPLDIQMHIDAFLMTVTVRRVGVQWKDATTSPQAAQPPTNKQALDLANEWHGQSGGELAPQPTSNEIAGMLAQFASDPTRDWPQWMKNQARVDTASFPTSPQAAQTEAALREVVRLSENAGLYDADFQTEAQQAFIQPPQPYKVAPDRGC